MLTLVLLLLVIEIGAAREKVVPLDPVRRAEAFGDSVGVPISGEIPTAVAIVARMGMPTSAVGGLLLYRTVFADTPASLSYFVPDGRRAVVTLDFSSRDSDLRRDADRVLKRLRVLLGAPANTTGVRGRYRTTVWRAARGSVEHTVVFGPDESRNTIHIYGRHWSRTR